MDKDSEESAKVEEGKRSFKRIFSRNNLLFILLFLIFLNLLYLDYLILQGFNIKTIEKIVTNPQPLSNTSENCSPDCIDAKISNAISKLKITGEITPSLFPTPTLSKVRTTNSSAQSNPKDYYVPFGSGSGSPSDWESIAGVSAYIDSTAYGNIKTVVFEVSLHIPTANEIVSVRLYNTTDGRVIAGSQLDFNGNTANSVLLSSQSINLDYANKFYTVQMKTQLGYQAILDQARVHITTK